MQGSHRRAVIVLGVSLVLMVGCEPLESLRGVFGGEGADEPSIEIQEGVEEDPPEGVFASEADRGEAGDASAPERAETPTEEPSEGPATEGRPTGGEDVEGPAEEAAPPDGSERVREAPCTAADTMLEAELPPQAERIETATGDLTGDGQADELITYSIGSGSSLQFWFRVVAASGYVVERPLDEAAEISPVQPLGAAALGGTREVAFVLEHSGASGVSVALYALHANDGEACALLPVTIPDHTVPRHFIIGGTVAQASGLGCGEVQGTSALLVTRAEQRSDGDHDWYQTAWHWPDAGALRFAGEDTATIADGDQIPSVGGIDCAGMGWS